MMELIYTKEMADRDKTKPAGTYAWVFDWLSK